MSGKTTFEHLCAGGTGFSCENETSAKLTGEESFQHLLDKLVTRCETNLIFLPSPTCKVHNFTLDIVPNYSLGSVSSAWNSCQKKGYDGLKVLASLDSSNMPKNSTEKYTFAQFAHSVLQCMEAYFMFQKFSSAFSLNAAKIWDETSPEEMDMIKSCGIVMVWNFERQQVSVKDLMSRSPLSHINADDISRTSSSTKKETVKITTTDKSGAKRKSLSVNEISSPSVAKRGRRSVAPPPPPTLSLEDNSEEEDPEISFKAQPDKNVPALSEPMEVEPKRDLRIEDVTLGFEKAVPKKADAKKSVGARKSLMPDWPEEEKIDVLVFFDNINPSTSEQSRIALSCKYASMQYDRELPSKLLYQWIQKKGRVIQKTNVGYELPEEEQKERILSLYETLKPEISETSRIAFTCKFLQSQYGIKLTSKEFYKWLNDREKAKKAAKRR